MNIPAVTGRALAVSGASRRTAISSKAIMLLVVFVCATGTSIAHMGIDQSEFQARRQAVMAAASGGITLLHSFSAPKAWRDSGFQQDANFYYLTGLENLHNAILAIDGTTRETWLFVMVPSEKQQHRFDALGGWDSVYLTPGHGTEQTLGIEHIVSWEQFADFIAARRKPNPNLALYLDQSREGKMMADVSNPPGLAAIENPYLLWAASIKARWPDANIVDAAPILQTVRAVKSPTEVALMKRAAAYTDVAFRAAVAAIGPGRSNREVEGVAIETALRAGADGVSMWPELKTGPVSNRTIFQKYYDYHLLNRTMHTGETVLMDLGFDHEYYKGDVGRTLPVSGHFTREQREVVDLMSGAYRSGLQVLRDGVSTEEILRACASFVDAHRQGLQSEFAKRAADELLKPGTWIIYTHGLEMVEIFPLKVLHAGNTVAFGPDFEVDGTGFYEEDVVLITAAGYQLINPPLPYSATDIEKTMARLRRSPGS